MLKILISLGSLLVITACSKVECHSTEVKNILYKIVYDNKIFEETLLEKNYSNSDIYKSAFAERNNCIKLINESEESNLAGELKCLRAFSEVETRVVAKYEKDFPSISYTLTDIVTLNKDPDTSRLQCEGNLTATLVDWGSVESRIKYQVDITSEGNTLVRVEKNDSIK
ncbi:hypothetical protein [uncultured Limnobacter sp.]|uniref:hypothetical protein n=1 Tax=uncultured Limnobacter sp. TaxID=199681 RepID=UPI0026320E93|nr:hypothetical protein [uncultured Limnobacter sp.]|tara:strand:- start:2488 stop:2994 length:507 start_codon:yes stop_codon:yes gene_type:complete